MNEKKQYPSQERLKELFYYDPDGFLVWNSGVKSGKKAGSYGVNKDLRVFYDVRINGKLYSGAKLIFIYFNGYNPKYIYHKNQDQHDNRILNLIGCNNRSGNNAGMWKSKPNKYRFISMNKGGKSWCNIVGVIRSFNKPEAAAYYANMEIDRLALNYQKNDIDYIDIEKYKCTGDYQIKNRSNRTSEYLGVSKHQKKWIVKCAHKYIGVFETQEQAAIAYNTAALNHYGESAVLNTVPEFLDEGAPF